MSGIPFKRFISGALLMFSLFSCKEESLPEPQPPSAGTGLEVLLDGNALSFSNGIFLASGSVSSKDGFTISEKGICFGISPFPQIVSDSVRRAGSGFGSFQAIFSLQDYERDWFVRAYAISVSAAGRRDTTYGTQNSLRPYHRLKPLRLNASGTDSIRINWDGLSLCRLNGLADVRVKGVCWSLSPNPKPTTDNFVLGSNTDSSGLSHVLSGLQAGQLYYFRAFAATPADTVFGTNLGCSTGLLDADGNFYPSLLLGSQVWMAANLRVGRFADGTPIEENPDNARWDSTTAPAAGFSTDNNLFGKFYNYYCITSEKKVCPAGWKIPSRADWDTLFQNYGGWENAGLALKTGNTAWGSSIPEGQGSSGFNALPAGQKLTNGNNAFSGRLGFWWVAPSDTQARAFRMTDLDRGVFLDDAEYRQGLSVRCIKD
jgi:uncharacterized protein (TIGR02145 family)